MKIKITGADSVIKSIKRFEKNVTGKKGVTDVNTRRAKKFRFRTMALTKLDMLGLAPISQWAISIRRKNLGGPIYDTGELLKNQEIRKNKDTSVDDGYFSDNKKLHTNTKLTNYELAHIHLNRPFLYNSAARWLKERTDVEIFERWVNEMRNKSGV